MVRMRMTLRIATTALVEPTHPQIPEHIIAISVIVKGIQRTGVM